MRKPLSLVWQVIKVVLAVLLGLFAYRVLYEVIWRYRLQGPHYQMALLVVPCAAYFWWLTDKVLRLLGFKRSAVFTLLMTLALMVWVLVATTQFQPLDVAEQASEGAWGYLERWVRSVVEMVY